MRWLPRLTDQASQHGQHLLAEIGIDPGRGLRKRVQVQLGVHRTQLALNRRRPRDRWATQAGRRT